VLVYICVLEDVHAFMPHRIEENFVKNMIWSKNLMIVSQHGAAALVLLAKNEEN